MEQKKPLSEDDLKAGVPGVDNGDVTELPSEPETKAFRNWVNRNLPAARGRWVALCGDDVDGPHPNRLQAHDAAFRRFGRQQVYLRQVGVPPPPVQEIY